MKIWSQYKITNLVVAFFTWIALSSSAHTQTADQLEQQVGALNAALTVSVPVEDLPVFLLPLTAADLGLVAETWQAYVRAELSDLGDTNIALRKAEGAAEELLRQRFSTKNEAVSASLEKYKTVLEAWSAKGAAEEDILPHRNYVAAVTTGALQTTDFKTLIKGSLDWLTAKDGGLRVLLLLMGIVVTIWIMMLLARIVRNMVRRALEKVPTLSRLLKTFVVGTVYWATLILGVLVALSLFGVNVTPLFAVFGGLSFILGFALQDTLGNLASGLMIMILKPFDTGDYIEVGGASGTVDEMSVVSTQIRTFDNQIIVVPNSKIWGDVITNVSASDTRRVDLVFGIAYTDNAAHAIKVLQGLVVEHDLCLSDPPPEIFVGELGDNSVNVFCRPWVKSEDYWAVYWNLTGAAKELFDAEGLSIPFPQRDVHLIPTEVQS